VGRVWYAYWLIPYPNQRMLWVNFKSPLLWDVFAVSTYLTISVTFFMVGLVPDLASMRDSARGLRKLIYTMLALGWNYSYQQWMHYARGYLLLAAFATPLVFSVHSIVSWDFAMSLLPGWHTTIFAPYFVAGAIFSGLAMVLTIVIPLRVVFDLKHYITDHVLQSMARVILFPRSSWATPTPPSSSSPGTAGCPSSGGCSTSGSSASRGTWIRSACRGRSAFPRSPSS
jgi:molybdopterin-containing oxidoreductase family membrane subunit